MCLEVRIFHSPDLIHVIDTKDIRFRDKPVLYWIIELRHAIVAFPDGRIFNCNPRDYTVDGFPEMLDGLLERQVEPDLEGYKKYRGLRTDERLIRTDLNCVLWSTYYLWWRSKFYIDSSSRFPSNLDDLEEWAYTIGETLYPK